MSIGRFDQPPAARDSRRHGHAAARGRRPSKKKKLHCLQVEMAGIVDDAVRLSGKWPHLPQ
jgi:hypothetical protein